MIQDALNRAWYRDGPPNALLRMLEGFYRRGLESRRRKGLANRSIELEDRPIIVVGNITAGGAGKTPLVIRLCRLLSKAGIQAAVVSRGYGRASTGPVDVTADTAVELAGDEPLLIARATGCAVRVDEDREAATLALFEQGAEVVVSDDGLQRWRLPREIEICVVDAQRGFGNGHLMPAGPLREPVTRLQEVDYVVLNGEGAVPDLPDGVVRMRFEPTRFKRLTGSDSLDPTGMLAHIRGRQVHAVAGIGNPERFFGQLESMGMTLAGRHAFADHHAYRQEDFDAMGDIVVMTDKDAVKCTGLDLDDAWSLGIEARLPKEWEARLLSRVQAFPDGQAS